ncbi:MAG TPA: RDD family protein [Bryobacteraceae bacterium]|nr:RDD family protein [Bryobacteraceae bacterium]
MQCQSCRKDVTPDMMFCAWCLEYLGAANKGKKANFFSRFVAVVLDPLIALLIWLLPSLLLTALSPKLGGVFAIVGIIGYIIWALSLFRQGMTPGKLLMGLQVVDQRNGEIPGFGKMFLREIVGRFISGLFLGLGYFWALFDKSAQAWHDKLAGTVVIKRNAPQVVAG